MKLLRTRYVCLFSTIALLFTGCGSGSLDEIAGEFAGTVENHVQTKVSIAPPPIATSDTITIASFNIQVFGQSKIADVEAMEVIVNISRQFDVLAIQEVRSSDQTLVPNFVGMLNAQGARYDYLVGPRQGRSMSKEQYVFVYDTEKVEPLDIGFVVPDQTDLLHRPPVASRFQVKTNGREPGFSFVLMNVHTDPDDTDIEIDALAKAFDFVQQNMLGEDDFIMLGDFNVGEKDYAALGALPDMAWAISSDFKTNTKGTKAYDNIFFNASSTTEFTGVSGVFDFMKQYNLSMEQAIKVSDHFPVWATFSSIEKPAEAIAASLPGDTVVR